MSWPSRTTVADDKLCERCDKKPRNKTQWLIIEHYLQSEGALLIFLYDYRSASSSRRKLNVKELILISYSFFSQKLVKKHL